MLTKRGGWPYADFPNTPFTINRESPQARGLVAWWPTLGSRGANVLRDYGGQGKNAVLQGGLGWQADQLWGAVPNWTSTNHMVGLMDDVLLQDDTPWTISMWALRTSAGTAGHTHLYCHNYAVGRMTRFVNITSTVTIQLRNDANNSVEWPTNILLNNWTLVTLMCNGLDSNNIELFLNANSQGVRSLADSTQTIRAFGSRSYPVPSYTWRGKLSDMRIYNVVLSPAVIWGMAHDKKWELYKPLRRWWAVRAPVGWAFNPVWSGRGVVGSSVIRGQV